MLRLIFLGKFKTSMVDKAVQVAIGSKRPRQAHPICETIPEVPKGKEERATQCGILRIGAMAEKTNTRSGGTMT